MSLPRRLAAGGSCVVLALAASSAIAQPPAPRLPTLPLTQLEEREPAADLDNRTFSLTFAEPVPIKDLLLLLVRGTNLSLIPDPALTGSFIGELKSVTVRQALASILPPLGLDYSVDSGFIHVFPRERETRLFDLHFIAADRTGTSTVGTAVEAGTTSAARLTTTSGADLFVELSKGIQSLLSERGSFNLDRKAGLLQATDFPERLDRVSEYLDAVRVRVHRQVELETRIVEVELTDADAPGIDWQAVASEIALARAAAVPGGRRFFTGLRVNDVARLTALLANQGTLTTVGNARLTTLNNEPAIVRSEAVALSITPQIAPEGVVTLSVAPIIKAPAVAESDTVARVGDGETLVVSGFTRTREVRDPRKAGLLGRWFGRRAAVTNRRVEIVLLLTPKIL